MKKPKLNPKRHKQLFVLTHKGEWYITDGSWLLPTSHFDYIGEFSERVNDKKPFRHNDGEFNVYTDESLAPSLSHVIPTDYTHPLSKTGYLIESGKSLWRVFTSGRKYTLFDENYVKLIEHDPRIGIYATELSINYAIVIASNAPRPLIIGAIMPVNENLAKKHPVFSHLHDQSI